MQRTNVFPALIFCWVVCSGPVARAAESAPSFADVRPILRAHCMKCHGLEDRKANLDLRTVALIRRGGVSGAVVVEGDAASSLLLQHVQERTMPPAGELPLTDDKVDLLRRWIDDLQAQESEPAAPRGHSIEVDARQFWAFQPPVRSAIPVVENAARARTPVAAFILARLEEKSLSLAASANRRTLIRRVYLDLVGFPPPPDAVERFVDDPQAEAYETLVDQLLASPHFGERWGRHWLDAAGYVDTIGDDTDATIAKVAKGKWRYRDYVVQAFNADKPFDEFVRQQIAGDEMVDWRSADAFTPEIRENLIATTFLRSAADETVQNELNTADIRHEVLARTMEVTVHNLLGLTVQCARCHTHKYDPIPQTDYYRMLALFTPALAPQVWLQPAKRELPDVAPKVRRQLEEELRQAGERRAALMKPHRERLLADKVKNVPEPLREDALRAVETPEAARDEIQKYLVEKFAASFSLSDEELKAALAQDTRRTVDAIDKTISKLTGEKSSWATIQAVYDIVTPPPTYLLRRGNHERPWLEVGPRLLAVLSAARADARFRDPAVAHSSGRRTVLARWLTEPGAASAGLMARVFVNRVWQQGFGRGLVETSDQFGRPGSPPSHPELLEWLSAEFMQGGWRLKALLRLLMTSAVYQQSSLGSAARTTATGADGVQPHDVDPGNRLLWKMPLRQLESEAIRDSLLVVGGVLDRTMGGPAIKTQARADGIVAVNPASLPTPTSRWRRSLYLLSRRRYHESFLEAFGQPELTKNCTRRVPSAVVGQSLTLMNDSFVVEQSSHFADRVLREAGPTNVERVTLAFQVALSRDPSTTELEWAHELLREQLQKYESAAAEPVPSERVTENVSADDSDVDPEKKPRTAETVPPKDPVQRALRHLCHMLLCTNEFLYVH